MTTQSRTVRVFLSSTFRDFAEERDLLVRKVFPELRRKCRARQVELVDVDLRWGITEEEAQQGKVLPICLAEIDRSRPYFMGFIGERYGWVPEAEKYDLSLIIEQPWLDELRGGKSVTELEMLHGVLNNPAMEDRAFFYFRDPAWSQKKGGAYLSEGSLEEEKLEALKNRIRQSGYPVVEDYPTPEALAERVKEDLWKLIDEAYPASEVPDALAQERMRHEVFAASRLGLYIGGERYFEALDAAMTEEPCKPILVCGASGGGKSALLANWAQKFSSAHSEAIVLTHFLGTGADAAHPVNMAIRLLREMARITGEEFVLEGDPRKALRMLGEWFEKAGAFARERGGVFVLVLDALDKMVEHRDLDWWPRKLPEGVAIVASCLDGDVRDTIARRMEWTEVRVSPLEPMDCERFMEDQRARYRKAVTSEQKALILAHPLCGNPLFLRTLLEELRVFGVYEELNRRLQHYLASETIDDLFEKVLDRIESDNTPETVRAALEVLWAAKESFAEDELLTVSQLPPAVWAPIHIALDESLIGAGGRLAFSHEYLRKAVRDRYLDSEAARQRIQKRMAEFCAQAMAGSRKETSRYVRRHAVEHFLEVEDWDNATAALSDLEFIEARAIAQELPAMLKDYAEAVKLLPEGEKERQTEAARQGNLDRYAQEMYKYAATWTRIRGGSSEPEPTLPRPVKSVRLWTEEEIAAERKRMTDTPNRLDIVKAFRVFVAINSAPLQQYSTQEGFAANLARNDAPAGPVHEEGKRRLEPLKCVKLIKHFAPEEIYNPLPACHAVLDGHTNRVFSLALSADGNRIVSGSSDKTLRVWDVKNGECLKIFQGHDYYSDFVLTGDGRRIVSGSSDKTLRVWDMQSGECLNIFDGHTDSVDMIRLTADDRLVVSGSSDNTLRMWNLGSGECLKVLQGHTGIVTSIALSADGRIAVSGSRDKTLRVWDLSSGECLKVLRGHASEVTSLSASLDFSLVVSQGWDKTLRVWDINSGECMHVLKGHQKPIIVSGLTQDMRRIVSLSEDMELRVWDLDTGNCKISYFNEEKGGDYYPISAVLNNNGKIFVFEKRTLRIWDIETSECLKVFEEPTGLIECLCISSDGKHIFSGSSEGTLRVWDMESGENHNIRERHHAEISSLSINIFGQRVISRARGDNKLRIWDLKSGKFIGLWPIDVGINGEPVALSANGRYIIAENKHAICVWDTETGQCINALIGHQGHVDKLSLTPDGRSVVSISWDKSLRVWNLSSGECINVLKSFQGNVDDIYISQDGCNIVSIDDKCTLRLWDLQTGCLLWTSDAKARKIALSPNGRQIIGVSGQLIQVINIKTGEILFDMEGHIRLVANAILTQDGNSVITISYDNTLRLWDIESGRCLSIFFKRGVAAIEFGNNQLPQIIIGSSNGDVEFYDIENLPLGPFITTAHRETLSKDLPAGSVAAQPACCGQQISIPTTIADQIEHWTHEGGEGGYTDPYLLLDCPNCGTPLRMNPFFVDINRNLQ